MNNSTFTTQGGIKIEKSITPLDAEHALDKIYQYIDTKKGALFVSNYEVPDRYSRWDLGFVHPALELIARKRQFEINALNPNGTRLLNGHNRQQHEQHPAHGEPVYAEKETPASHDRYQ